MAQIISAVVQSDVGSTDRRIRVTVVLENNAGDRETLEIGPIFLTPDMDAATVAQQRAEQLLIGKAEGEESAADEVDIENFQDNPLTFVLNPKWSTSKALAKRMIRWMMRERDPRIVVFLEPLIDYLRANYTAAQLANFLDITTEQVIKLNNRVNAILQDTGTVKAQLLVFDGELEDID